MSRVVREPVEEIVNAFGLENVLRALAEIVEERRDAGTNESAWDSQTAGRLGMVRATLLAMAEEVGR